VRATAIQADALVAILPALFLIDLEADRNSGFRFRFCGAAIATRYGRDLTDDRFLSLWGPVDAATLRRDLGASAFRSTGMVAGVLAETLGGGVVSLEMTLLPLAGANGAAGAIGSMARIGGHDESNRVRARVVSQSLRSIRFLPDTAFLGKMPRRASDRMPPEVRLPSPHTVATPRRYGHLTVLSGGK
jgi:hypothetical protein